MNRNTHRSSSPAHTRNATSQTVALDASSAQRALRNVLLVGMAIVALVLASGPMVLHAQSGGHDASPAMPAPVKRTMHTVSAKESLWSIAVRYYGNGGAWRELARSNGIAVDGSRPLTIGMQLRVPAAAPLHAAEAHPASMPTGEDANVALALAVAPPKASAGEPASSRASLAAQTAGKGDASATMTHNASAKSAMRSPQARPASPSAGVSASPRSKATVVAVSPGDAAPHGMVPAELAPTERIALGTTPKQEILIDRGAIQIGLVDAADARAARGSEQSTIFLLNIPTLQQAEAALRESKVEPVVAPRRGEFNAAPFGIESARLASAGRVVRRVGAAAMGSVNGAQQMLIADEVEISAPAGVALAVGDQLLTLQPSGVLADGRQIVTPGGVLQVRRVDARGMATAFVRTQSGRIEQGQAVVLASGSAASVRQADPVSGDAMHSTVAWVDHNTLLPTLQSYLLLDAGSKNGVQQGDEFALMRGPATASPSPDNRIALVRVVRVDEAGSTAIVIHQDRGEIAAGVTARRVARMP